LTHLGEAEESRGHKWVIDEKSKAKEHPKDYFVPNFGADQDVGNSHSSISWAERSLNHKWNYDPNAKKAAPPPMNYPVPNFGMDADIAATQANIAAQEKVHGKLDIK